MVRMDIINELGLPNPDTWTWDDLLNAAKTIYEKKKMAGIALALGRNLATAYYFAALLHSAGGRMFDVDNKFEVVFDSPETVETLEFIDHLRPYMPRGATEYSFLQVVDSMVTGEAAMVFYWGRVYGRAAVGGTGDIQEHRVLQSRASSPHREPVQLERLPGLGHSQAEQPVH